MDVPMRMPDLATTDSPVKVIRWLVDPGQPVMRGQPLMEVETDKAVMDLESVVTGVLSVASVQPGDEVMVGQVIAVFEAEGAAGPVTPPDGTGASKTPPQPPSAPTTGWLGRNAPVPTTKADASRVSFFARNRARREEPTRKRGLPLSIPQKTLARRMTLSQQTVPAFDLQISVNAGPMLARRAAASVGRPIAWDAFFVHAVGQALAKFPDLCHRYEDDRLVPHAVIAVNVAVDLGGDLFAVTVDRPEAKSIEAVSDEIRAGVARLDSGDPHARVTKRAVLTVSNLGSTGVEAFRAVINPPETAVLAVGRVGPAVVAVDGRAVVQNRVNLTLSVDHRVVNGKYAAGFLMAIARALEAIATHEGEPI
jgi:pyruvate dehydrogenase E2 component (dihydrolipoamide acetyltransferase)